MFYTVFKIQLFFLLDSIWISASEIGNRPFSECFREKKSAKIVFFRHNRHRRGGRQKEVIFSNVLFKQIRTLFCYEKLEFF
jgi:hypothetical protein